MKCLAIRTKAQTSEASGISFDRNPRGLCRIMRKQLVIMQCGNRSLVQKILSRRRKRDIPICLTQIRGLEVIFDSKMIIHHYVNDLCSRTYYNINCWALSFVIDNQSKLTRTNPLTFRPSFFAENQM